jgi:hypothetical protein
MVDVQAIAELVDTSSDLLLVNGEIRTTRHTMLVPCQIGRVPYV